MGRPTDDPGVNAFSVHLDQRKLSQHQCLFVSGSTDCENRKGDLTITILHPRFFMMNGLMLSSVRSASSPLRV